MKKSLLQKSIGTRLDHGRGIRKRGGRVIVDCAGVKLTGETNYAEGHSFN
jgi:hypothetical protein